MKEIELTGKTIEEIYEKLKNNDGKQIRQHLLESDTSSFLDLIRFCKFTCPMGEEVVKLFVSREEFSLKQSYELNISIDYPEDRFKLFLLIEEETTETFEEMTRRKQEEIFRRNL